MKHLIVIVFIFLFVTVNAQVDEHRNDIQAYSPSVVLGKGNWEYKFFNNLYTQTKNFDLDGNRVRNNQRSSYFTSIHQFLYGVSGRVNIGADIWIKSVRRDGAGSSPFEIFRFGNNPNARTAITGIGPKVKFAPVKKIPGLSVQSSFLFPVAKDAEGRTNGKPYLSADSYLWITQIYYDQPIGRKLQFFFQFSPWLSIRKMKADHGTNQLDYSNPVSIYFSYYATKRLTFYVQNEFWMTFGKGIISSWFRQEGIGMKVQIIKGLMEAEASYTKFTMGKDSGAGETYNLGLRFIH